MNCSITESEREVAEVIEIEATSDLDGVPVECFLDSFMGQSHNEYSPFVLIRVNSPPQQWSGGASGDQG